MKKTLLIALILPIAIYANITDLDGWKHFEETSGLQFLKDKYQATVLCHMTSPEIYLCKAVSSTFQVNYHLSISHNDSGEYIDVISAPEIIHYATSRLNQCPSHRTHTSE